VNPNISTVDNGQKAMLHAAVAKLLIMAAALGMLIGAILYGMGFRIYLF